MFELVSWERLDEAGFPVTAKRSVRRVAWFLLIVGAFILACGVMAHALPLVGIGVLYVCVGAWNLRRTSVHGLLIDGMVLIVAGIFTALAWRWIDGGATHMVKALVGGSMQILWAVRRLRFWSAARHSAVDPAAMTRLEEIVKVVSKRSRRDDTVVEFTTGRIRKHRNRLGLFSEGVVGLLMEGAVRLEKRPDIWIEARGTGVRSESVKVSVRMSDLELLASMDAKHLERFERWKLGMAATQSVAA